MHRREPGCFARSVGDLLLEEDAHAEDDDPDDDHRRQRENKGKFDECLAS
jgi:hypothetical protein